MAESTPEGSSGKEAQEQPTSVPDATTEPVLAIPLHSKSSPPMGVDTDAGTEPQSALRRLQAEIHDAVELMEYSIATGMALDDKILERIKKAENWLRPSAKWPEDADRAEFERAYRDLAIFMKPVTIETLHATKDGYRGPTRSWVTRNLIFTRSSDARLFSKKLWSWVLLTSLFIVVFQTLSTSYGIDEEIRASGWSLFILFGRPLTPFLYGLLGSLTYLLRSAHGYINDRTFNMTRAPEYYNRMLLGFTSGGIILLFVDPKSFGVTDGAIAFIVGYNTDYLFETIERIAGGIFPKVSVTVAAKDGLSKPGIAKIQIAVKELEPGARGNGTVLLTAPAPTEGVVVTFSADHAVTISQPVTVLSGSTSAQFSFTVAPDAVEGMVSITASANGTSASDSVKIVPELAVQSVTLQKVGNEFTATVVLNREPLTGDARVSVSIDPPSFGTLPNSELVVPKGQKQAVSKGSLNPAPAAPVPPGKFIATLGKSKKEASF